MDWTTLERHPVLLCIALDVLKRVKLSSMCGGGGMVTGECKWGLAASSDQCYLVKC